MGKLHELLAVEATVVGTAEKLVSETNEKFHKFNEYFLGGVKTLERLKDSPEDKAIEAAQRQYKALPTTVPETLAYLFPHIDKAMSVKLQKHLANQKAAADVLLNGRVIFKDAPVDFLLDLERLLPKWRSLFAAMPTLDPSRDWTEERKGVWKTKDSIVTAQTEKQVYPVVLAQATDKHPAQVKESSRDVVVGKFVQVILSGAATSQQKADLIALCDSMISAVKQARMRANSVDVPSVNVALTTLFNEVFD